MKHRVVEELDGVATLLGLIWIVFGVDWLLPADLTQYGLVPRTTSGLAGILTMPFLHADFGHLFGNTVPLIILLGLLAGSRANSYAVVPQLIVGGGLLLWCFGRTSRHVGASGLVYALIAFLIISGVRERRPAALIISIFVGLTYGATLLTGVLPTVGEGISWDGHLAGAVAGAVIAWFGSHDDPSAETTAFSREIA
ncbi:MAG: rhomboid family intramembrane serine protease [Planctomycetaceae bacterium]|nr:rhomboid family intramembrane serine protease [Planctomycetaceae bacterium]